VHFECQLKVLPKEEEATDTTTYGKVPDFGTFRLLAKILTFMKVKI
jgi:hypothetical protein